jgi:putative CRISPR-associated protein (TIGR02619 family)
MPNVIVSPCGTSLLTNQIDDSLRKLINRNSNLKEAEISSEDKAQIDRHYQQRSQELNEEDIEGAKKLSAELNGILTYSKGQISTSDHYYLIATDTYVGGLTATLVTDWIKSRQGNAFLTIIRDLSTKEIETFRLAMSEIVRWCDYELNNQYPQPAWKRIFNLTGGFKSVNGFLQALAMFYADESIYIFESDGQLLTIPKLPIKLSPEDDLANNLDIFRRLAILGHEISANECQNISGTLLEQVDDRASLSEWGQLVWQQFSGGHYQNQLLPPLTSKLKYSEEFVIDIQSLPRDRLAIINARLDDLTRCLESNGEYNPRSLRFHSLEGRPFRGRLSPEPTHECYAWSDKDAKRIYGHFEDNVFIIDKLGLHL